MRYLIKSQLIQVVKKLAYTAYGFDINLTNQQVHLVLRNGQQNNLCYKFPISQMIYQQYRKDGFIYSDPGTTPKLIAEDILDHFKSLGHVQMESDQFGNILGYIKQKYFQQTFKEIKEKQKISILNCEQFNHHLKKSQQTAGQPQYSVNPYLQKSKIINPYRQGFNLNQNSKTQNNFLKQNNKQLSQVQISKSPENIQNLNIYINFTKHSTKLSLNQLRQKYYRQSLIRIDKDIFQHQFQQIQIFQSTIQKYKGDFFTRKSKNVSNICLNVLCLRHQLINSQTVVERIIKDYLTNKTLQQVQAKYLKFGIVNPQQLIYNSAQLDKISQQEVKKLKTIFLSVPAQYPVNLKDKNLSTTLSKQSQKLNKKLVKMFPGLNLSEQYLLAISKSQKLAQNHLNRILLIIYELICLSDLPKLYSLYLHIEKFKNILQKSHNQSTDRLQSLQKRTIYNSYYQLSDRDLQVLFMELHPDFILEQIIFNRITAKSGPRMSRSIKFLNL